MYNASSVILASLYLIELDVFFLPTFPAISYYRAVVVTSLSAQCDLVPRHKQTGNEAPRSKFGGLYSSLHINALAENQHYCGYIRVSNRLFENHGFQKCH